MKNLGRGVAVVCCALILARPGFAWADVVPARKASADRDSAAVEKRLVALGLDTPTAKSGAEGLTPSELRFFAEDSSRLNSVGGLTWSEWMGGGAVLLLLTFIYFAFIGV
ncbi:MAG TPA: hypothetical protein VK661_07995 [Planctomycetota bacterium]|nr:hypothetical protein [Planctomycetota bacterium]